MMFSLIVVFNIHQDKKVDFEKVIAPVIQATQNEEGNLEYRLSVDESDGSRYFLYEIYQDRAAYEFHTQQSYLKNFRELLDGVLKEPASVIRGPIIQG